MNKEEVVQNIKDNYKYLEKSIVNQLNLKVDNHYLTAGHNSEKIWLNLFRQIPCTMCAGAIVLSRIDKVYIGTMDPKSGACGSV